MSSSDILNPVEPLVTPTVWSLEELDGTATEPIQEETPAITPEEQHRLDIEAAFERGRKDGYAAGEAKGNETVKAALATLASTTEAFRNEAFLWREQLARNLHALAVAIAKQVVQRELRAEASEIERVVSLALTEFPMEEAVTVRINPADLGVLSAHAVEAHGEGSLTGGREIKWRADPQIQSGGCVVEGVERLVDGRVDTALLRIYQRLGDA